MKNGISVYFGLTDDTINENIKLIERAHSFGIRRVFTSFNIPEANIKELKNGLEKAVKIMRELNMEIIADITPGTLKKFGIDDFSPNTLRMMGIYTIRADAGLSAQDIARMSRNKHNMRILLNASTVTGKFLTQLVNEKTNFSLIDAMHNFYPRPGTGLSEETVVRKTAMFHKAGIRVGAFVVGSGKKRSPLYEGLPTLEDHRHVAVDLAARHLVAMGIDSVFVGDNMPTDEDLKILGSLSTDRVTIKAHLLTQNPTHKELLSHVFTARQDEARDAIRAEESRRMVSAPIYPENTVERTAGSVTIDNEKYLRYMGELEIMKYDLPADERVNVVAKTDENEMFLLDYITPGRRFSFDFEETRKDV